MDTIEQNTSSIDSKIFNKIDPNQNQHYKYKKYIHPKQVWCFPKECNAVIIVEKHSMQYTIYYIISLKRKVRWLSQLMQKIHLRKFNIYSC